MSSPYISDEELAPSHFLDLQPEISDDEDEAQSPSRLLSPLEPGTTQARGHRIEPPPERAYDTLDELKAAVSAWTKEHGFELVIDSSQKTTGGVVRKYLRCGRGSKTQNKRKHDDTTWVRQTTSHKSLCPMSMQYVYEDESWSIVHNEGDKSFFHNHPPLPARLVLTNHRKLDKTEAVKSLMDSHQAASISVKQSLAAIKRQFPSTSLTSKDISNHRYSIQRKLLQRHTLVDATLERLR